MELRIKQKLSSDMEEGINAEFIPVIADDSEDNILLAKDIPTLIGIIPLRNMIVFPKVVMSVSVGRTKSLKLIREAYNNGDLIATFTQKRVDIDDPDINDLYTIGTIVKIIRIIELPDNTTAVILQGIKRAKLIEIPEKTPYLKGKVELIEDIEYSSEDRKFEALVQAIKDVAFKIIKGSGHFSPEASFTLKNIQGNKSLINFICANFGFKLKDRLQLLSIDDYKQKCNLLFSILNKEEQLLDLKNSIQSKAQADINQQQREYFLQQQIKTIQDELGGDLQEEDVKELREKAKGKKWSSEVAEIFEKELGKLERTSTHSPDYGVQINYLETLVNLPWNKFSKDNFNLVRAEKTLNKDFYGLEKIKERILEHIAVLKLKGNLKSPIICLYGPPGVGKTSLGKSIADSLNRKYIRMSLGGLHDEAEIRGHRRTYVGAMPGRIIQNIIKAGYSNPVFILDEIDKIGNDYKGDPSSALLEVLDPEQNNTFHDNYLDIDYDLSNVLFIATANDLSGISEPLRDRMEMIECSGYLTEEKIEIANRHLVKKELENNGIRKDQVKISKAAIKKIIESYTRESGVRTLEKTIAKVMRKAATKIAVDENYTTSVTPKNITDFLGRERFQVEEYEGNDYSGFVTGLAWTSAGGCILYIESSLYKGKSAKLTLTGNLGDVMKESAIIALNYVKAHASKIGIDQKLFEENDVHLHVPEGAIPKDGPSAGITMVTSLASAFTKRKVKKNLAMTGEITLRGKVLPVGGIKEKILAAKRSGIKELILCYENQKDIEEINPKYIEGLKFHYVKDAMEVLKIALLDEKVKD